MSARVFISYRSSDGADKATALARDLDARFGNSQVFLDKEDLPAGSRWRDAISQAISGCPILLVLVTPNYLGAHDSDGRRCIDHADDPARAELEAAIAAKAHVIPLLCDGVAATPSAADLPKPFDLLAELQWGHLRAFDWREDLGRLAADLLRLGVTAAGDIPVAPLTQPATMPASLTQPATEPAPFAQPVTTPMPLFSTGSSAHDGDATTAHGRRLALGAGALLLLAAGGWGAWRWKHRRATNLSGRWRVRIGARGTPNARDGAPMFITLEQAGQKLFLASSTLDVEHDPDWQDYRDFWRQRNGSELKRVFYRGEGKVLTEDEEDDDSEGEAASAASRGAIADRAAPSAHPLATHRIAIAVQIFAPGGGGEAIDDGALRGLVDPDDQRIHARLWLNSEQAERVVELRRGG